MNSITICNRIIEFTFYALFFFVPLVFFGDTSELFEFNKMWLTFALTIIIAASWGIKMVLNKEFRIQKTPLDLPILLFLLSQAVSTIFSLDMHTSIWGFYSRFNGGLFSIIAYIFLYYAFVSNFTKDMAKKSLLVTLASGLVVTLWGLPSHFGYDPTCLIFRGTFDVSCWTEAFQPKIRIFSTLGQPNWLAAYLAILIPISIAISQLYAIRYTLLTILFYVAILYTGSRSGFLGLLAGGLIFFILSNQKQVLLKFVIFPLLILSLFIGTPIDSQIKQFTSKFLPQSSPKYDIQNTKYEPRGPALETGGTESGTIRLIVWRGAIDAWMHNPIFGTGVETFAFAYYKYRPEAHNLTSEWDYLYNKAHNEYLNYLATTGIFGLGSYLFMIGIFIVLCIKYYVSSIKQKTHNTYYVLLTTSLLASYISILISNFLGFSVVIINIYFFLIPAFVFVLGGMINTNSNYALDAKRYTLSWILIFPIILTTGYLLLSLYRFWDADKSYARGYNLNRAGQYQYAYNDLLTAVEKRTSEPVFIDELSYNTGVIAAALHTEKESVEASESAKVGSYATQLTKDAMLLSDKITREHPNNIVFWKTRIRILNLLAQENNKYIPLALDAAKKASELAPTDAKVAYSLGILYGQNNQKDKAIETLKKTTELKPNYKEAYYALGLFYHDLATDKNSKIIDITLQKKAIDTMQYILDNIASSDAQAKKAIETWEKP